MARCMRMDCCKLRHIFSVFLNQRQHNGERRALPHFAVHRYGAVGNLQANRDGVIVHVFLRFFAFTEELFLPAQANVPAR